jgi:hypothetical protein
VASSIILCRISCWSASACKAVSSMRCRRWKGGSEAQQREGPERHSQQ